MRLAVYILAIGIVLTLLQSRPALAYHDLTCHPPPPPSGGGGGGDSFFDITYRIDFSDEELNLIVPGTSGATSSSCSSAGGDPIEVALPPDDISALEHVPGTGQDGRYWLFEPVVSEGFLDPHIGQSADLPNFTKPDGTPLLTQYKETNYDFLLSTARRFTPRETFSVSAGEIGGWPGATLLEMPPSFTLDELLAADPSRFPLYSGMAQVADIARISVVPEPGTLVLLSIGALGSVPLFSRGHVTRCRYKAVAHPRIPSRNQA
jgi:hypothetical protein